MAGQMLTILGLMLLVGHMAAVDVCDPDECSEMPPGLSLMQLRAKAHEQKNEGPSLVSECAWTRSPKAKFPSGQKYLTQGVELAGCEAAALADCECKAAISYERGQNSNKNCWCATGSLETSSQSWTDVWTSDCPTATCEVFGDPHIQVFDKPAETMFLQLNTEDRQPGEVGAFETGDFWLVKSDLLQIQGRYSTVKQRDSSKPFMTGVAIGGSFLQGNKLLIETMYQNGTKYPEGSSAHGSGAKWKGKQILTTLPSEFEEGGLIKAKYHNESSVVQDPAKHTRGIDVQLPRGVKLTVNRFPHHIGLAITMTRLAVGEGGQDGQCGNFNGNATDDTAELIQQRMGHQVAANDLLF
jgi:hypothetical protein